MSVAGLLAGAIGLMVTSILFTSAQPDSTVVAIIAVLALVLLASSVAVFAWAGQHASQRPFNVETLKVDIEGTLQTIAHRSRVASALAVIALALALVVAGASLLLPEDSSRADMMLTPSGLSAARAVCPALQQSTIVRLHSSSLTSNTALVRMQVPEGACGGHTGSRVLLLPRADIAALRVVGQ